MRSSSVEIRPYRLSDARELAATINTVCAEGRWMRTTRFGPTPAWRYALGHPNAPSHLLLVACVGEHVVGWCRAFPGDGDGTAGMGIGVLEPYRNRGVGTRMLQTMVGWARQRGLQRMVLTTRMDNDRAIHLFRKFGFREAGEADGKWIWMTLPL